MKPAIAITELLLLQYLKGRVSLQEEHEIQNWLRLPANQQKLESLKLVWELTAPAADHQPDLNKAWLRIQNSIAVTEPKAAWYLNSKWALRAAAILLLAVGVYAGWKEGDPAGVSTVPAPTVGKPKDLPAAASGLVARDLKAASSVALQPEAEQEESRSAPAGRKKKSEDRPGKTSLNSIAAAVANKEQICNSTLCPLEVCIVQALECSEGDEQLLAHCSVLEPDISGTIHYKSVGSNAVTCQAPVREVRIRRVTTGETIVLTDTSAPVTAQAFFDYLTGEKTGHIIAGIFEADCNNQCMDQSIRLDNRLGIPTLQ